MSDQRVTVEVELRASGNLSGALVAQRQLAVKLGEAVTRARLPQQFAAVTRIVRDLAVPVRNVTTGIVGLGRELAAATRQAGALGRAVGGIGGVGGGMAGMAQRPPTIGALVAGQLLAARLARPAPPSTASIRAAREQLIAGHGARIQELQQAGPGNMAGNIAARMHANSYLSAPMFQTQADELRRQQFRDAERVRAETRRSRLTMDSPAHRKLLLENTKGQLEKRKERLEEQRVAADVLAKDLEKGYAPTYGPSKDMARKTYEEFGSRSKLAMAQSKVDRLRAQIEINTLMPPTGEGRQAIAADFAGRRAMGGRDLTRQRVGAEVQLAEMGKPGVQQELVRNIELTNQATAATNRLTAAQADLERQHIGSPAHVAALKSGVGAAALQGGNALRTQLAESQARVGFGRTPGGMSEMREQVRLQRQLAASQRSERVQGLMAGGQTAFSANWQLMNEGLSTTAERLQGLGRTAGMVFAGLAAGIGGAVAAASPVAWDTLTGSVRLLAAQLGRTFIPIARDVSEWLQGVARWVGTWDNETRQLVRTVALWAAGLAGVVWAGARVVSVVSSMSTAFHGLIQFANLNPVIAGVTALSVVVGALALSWHRAGVTAQEAARRMVLIGSINTRELQPLAQQAVAAAQERAQRQFGGMNEEQRGASWTGLGSVGRLREMMTRLQAGGAGGAFTTGTGAPQIDSQTALDLARTGPTAFGHIAGFPEQARSFAHNLEQINTAWAAQGFEAPVRTLEEFRTRLANVNTFYEQHSATLANARVSLNMMIGALERTGAHGARPAGTEAQILALRELRTEITERLTGTALRGAGLQNLLGIAPGGAGGAGGPLDFGRHQAQIMAPADLYERILMQTQMSPGEMEMHRLQAEGNAEFRQQQQQLIELRRAVERVEGEMIRRFGGG